MNDARLVWSSLSEISHLNISENLCYDKTSHPFAGGSYGDIRLGVYTNLEYAQVKVAVKCLRIFRSQYPNFMKVIEREIRIWSSLHHPNVLPFLGFCLEEGSFPALVSEFMENGTVLNYSIHHPEVDVTGLMLGIAEGVAYLHSKGVIHSDLKSGNVLVSATGVPLISDFGISRVISISESLSGQGACAQPSSGDVKGSSRWMSPELLLPTRDQTTKHTKESDVWAFGMTAYELLAKKRPYHSLQLDAQVILAIVHGQRPEQPQNLVECPMHYQKAWQICEECWSRDPNVRPKMATVLMALRFNAIQAGVVNGHVVNAVKRANSPLRCLEESNASTKHSETPRRKAAKSKNVRPCAPCQQSHKACRGGMPCERCVARHDPENCIPRRRRMRSSNQREVIPLSETQESSRHRTRSSDQTGLTSISRAYMFHTSVGTYRDA
ncbi:kinase-like protein [Fomitiporia mediterranea MF3/22]|uniref:kinase-like protein n=1 Tax=Fomitiporia mediterranea (strain MF3/22) TaxID=694068 RepID=UPI0004408412|nr:kinase-like protein [Fomitiporia mediterranea MF3/22]EJD08301.1 kinase-like protein [Fomitiporia mediterranea MF3/22]